MYENVEMLLAGIQIQTDLLIQLSSAVMGGTIVTLARYFLPIRGRSLTKVASHWWLYCAIAASALSVIAGFVSHSYITGFYYEAAVRPESNAACIESVNYFVCDTGGILQKIALLQMALCAVGVLLLTLWYCIQIMRVRKT